MKKNKECEKDYNNNGNNNKNSYINNNYKNNIENGINYNNENRNNNIENNNNENNNIHIIHEDMGQISFNREEERNRSFYEILNLSFGVENQNQLVENKNIIRNPIILVLVNVIDYNNNFIIFSITSMIKKQELVIIAIIVIKILILITILILVNIII